MKIGILILLSLFATGLLHAADAPPAIPSIPVVHTWGDLLATTPITVESDKVLPPGSKPKPGDSSKLTTVSVHVGIDRDHSTSYGGALLYCLAKGVSFLRTTDQDLGPFRVCIHDANGITTAEGVMAYWSSIYSTYNGSSYLLFTQSFPLGGSGKYVIELLQPLKPGSKLTPKIFARTEVQVSGEPVLPWSPWGESKKEELRWSPQGGDVLGMTDTYTSMTVCNPVGGIAIPKTPEPFIIYQEVPARNTLLPQLNPEQPDAETQLKMVGNNLVVTMSRELEIYFPDDHFLTCWWVNDKPYVPDPNIVEEQKLRDLGARIWDVKQVHFVLDFRPERLGAKKGDKISVQLLFCTGGWQGCGWLSQAAMAKSMRDQGTSLPPANFSFPSNRVDFIYSGDPKNVQQINVLP